MIIYQYSDFRRQFALLPIVNTVQVNINSTNKTVSRPVGDFVVDGYEAGMTLRITDAVSSTNNSVFKIAAVTAGRLDLDVTGPAMVDAILDTVTLTAEHIDNDGEPRWPYSRMRPDGSEPWATGSFDGGFGGLFGTITNGDDLSVSINGTAADAVPGDDEYDWYLSEQKRGYTGTTIAPEPPTVDTFSGSVVLSVDVAGVQPPEVLGSKWRNTELYVQRRSDKAIQWIDMFDVNIIGSSG